MSVREFYRRLSGGSGDHPAEFVKVVRVDQARLSLGYTDKPLQVYEFRRHAA